MHSAKLAAWLVGIVFATLALGAATASAGPALVVNSLADTVAADGQCTLREAIENHNAQAQPNADCAKGKSKDTITFGTIGHTIFLAGSQLPPIFGKLTIDGGNAITIDGSSSSRLIFTTPAATLTLQNLTLTHGSDSAGGAVYNAGALTLDHATISNNSASGAGGGVYSDNGSVTTVLDSGFDHNTTPGVAGGLLGFNVTVIRSRFTFNHADQLVGGLFALGLTMTDSRVSSNNSGAISGMLVAGAVSIRRSLFNQNISTTQYGTVFIQTDQHAVLDQDTIRDNQAGCYNAGLTTAASGFGSVLITNTTIEGNSTIGGCGSISSGGLLNLGALTVANSTIANNSAGTDPEMAGGILSGGSLSLVNVTIAGNSISGGSGTGGLNDVSGLTFANTIIAGNSDGDDADCGAGVNGSNGHNIDGDGTCNLGATGDQPSTDPDLGPLQGNGGPTANMLPSSSSPALGAGDKKVCSKAPVSGKDQRGIKRPQGAGCDVGSVERVLP